MKKLLLVLLFIVNVFAVEYKLNTIDSNLNNLIDLNLNQSIKTEEKLEKQKKYINNILEIIKSNSFKNISYENYSKKIENLNYRIKLNKTNDLDNNLYKDELELKRINEITVFYSIIDELVLDIKTYKKSDELLLFLDSKLKGFQKRKYDIEKYYKRKIELENKEELSKSETKLLKELTLYFEYRNQIVFILERLIDKVDELEKDNFIVNKLNINYLVNKINNQIILEEFNNISMHLFKTDLGRILIGSVLFFIILGLRFIILPLVVSILEKWAIKKENDTKVFVLNVLKTPIKYALMVFGIEVFMRTIHNEQFNLEKALDVTNSIYAIIFGLFMIGLLNKGLETYSNHFLDKYQNIKKELILFIKRILSFLIVAIIITVVLSNFGFNITALLGGLGVLGLGVSLASKDTFSNLLGSINIMMDQVFSQGDWIQTNTVNGTVVEIGMRVTKVRDFENGLVSVPNAELANTTIRNWNQRVHGRRIKFKLGITYETPLDKFKQIIEDINEMLLDHDGIASSNKSHSYKGRARSNLLKIEDDKGIKKTLLVHFDEFADSSRNIEIYCFSKTVDWAKWKDVKQDVLFKIEEIVEKNNGSIAYPTQTIILDK